MTRDNQLKRALAQGNRVFGTWSMLSSPAVVNVVGHAGLDFVIVDLEHSPASFETMEAELYASEAAGTEPVVRLAEVHEETILKVLDSGAQSLLVSKITDASEAASVVSAALYPPEGRRGLSPFTRLHGYSTDDLARKLARANEETLVGVLVEGPEGVANLDQIAATPGLDLVYLGIYDLSATLGVPGELRHPKVVETVRTCVKTIERHGSAAGSVAPDREYLGMLADAGFRFLSYRADSAILREGLETARGWYEEL